MKLFSKDTRRVEAGTPGSSPPSGRAEAATSSAAYDKLEVVSDSGEKRWMTREHFEGLPLVDRVRLLASGGLSFYREGAKVGIAEAMRSR